MTPNSPPADPETFALWRQASDMSRRTRMGGSFYLVAWLMIWLSMSEPMQIVGYGVLGTVFFATMLISRWLHQLPAEPAPQNLKRWINQHWTLVIITTGIWGLVNGLVLNEALFRVSHLVAIIGTIAFSTAFAFTFAMNLPRCVSVLLLLNLPGLVALANGTAEQQPAFLCLAIYMVYLLLACRRSHIDYHTTLGNELQLLRQRNELEELSRTDSLTQLGNRYQFNDIFQTMIATAQRQHSPLSLVLLDIDHFKRVNDQFGHVAGDQCLQQFSELMRQVFRRDSDVPLRLGGEEFGVIMPGTTLEQASLLAEQFRASLETHQLQIEGQSVTITTSLGAGAYDTEVDRNGDGLYRRVDAALYQAKHDGRNCLRLAEIDGPASISRHVAPE
jgi:diguanylate cyclase (GGDEF)-like protein